MDQIERAAIAMAGKVWAGMSDTIKEQYRELARRAQAVFHNGEAADWSHVEVGIKVVLMRERSALVSKRHGDDATGRVARKVVENMQRSGYTVILGPPSEGAGGHFFDPYPGEPK